MYIYIYIYIYRYIPLPCPTILLLRILHHLRCFKLTQIHGGKTQPDKLELVDLLGFSEPSTLWGAAAQLSGIN